VFHKFRQRLRAIGELGSPYALTECERALLASLASHRHHNIAAIAIRHQLNDMLRFKPFPISGFPDWLERTRSADGLRVVQRRGCGQEYSLPWTGVERAYDFPISIDGRGAGSLRIVSEGITIRFEVLSPVLDDLLRAQPGAIRVGAGEWADEREYWSTRALPDERLYAINQIILATVVSGRFQKDLILPGTPLEARATIGGVPVPASYQRLLSYSNGININHTLVYPWIPKQKEGGRSAAVYTVGSSESGDYCLEVSPGNIALDRVQYFDRRSTKPRREFTDAIDMCVSLLRQRP